MTLADRRHAAPMGSTGDDPVIAAYKRDVDRTILRENLKLSVDDRFRQFESFMRGVYELRAAGRRLGDRSPDAASHD